MLQATISNCLHCHNRVFNVYLFVLFLLVVFNLASDSRKQIPLLLLTARVGLGGIMRHQRDKIVVISLAQLPKTFLRSRSYFYHVDDYGGEQ